MTNHDITQAIEARVVDACRCLGHLMVATGEHRYAEARYHSRQALDLTTKHQMAPVALHVCVGVDQLQAQAGEMQRAIEILSLATHHEASTFATREQGRQLLATLLEQIPREAPPLSQSSGQDCDLWAIVQEVLTTLQHDIEPMPPLATIMPAVEST